MSIMNSFKEMMEYTGLKQEDCLELYHDFFDEFEQIENPLLDYCKNKNYIGVYKEAHKLSGLFANLYLNEISEIAIMIKSSAKYGMECSDLISLLVKKCELLAAELTYLDKDER